MRSRIPRLRIFLMRTLLDIDHTDRVWAAMQWEWGSPFGERIIAARARGDFDDIDRFKAFRAGLARAAGSSTDREEQQ